MNWQFFCLAGRAAAFALVLGPCATQAQVAAPSSASQEQANAERIECETDTIVPRDPKIRLRVGVRRDARPFSYHSTRKREVWNAAPEGKLAKEGYTGFMVRICDAALTAMMVDPPPGLERLTHGDIEVVGIEDLLDKRLANIWKAAEKSGIDLGPIPETEADLIALLKPHESEIREKLNVELEVNRFQCLGPEFDILCGPATITNERRLGFIVSPPLFTTGIGMISLKSLPVSRRDCPEIPLIGYVGETTAGLAGIRAILESNELNEWREQLTQVLQGNDSVCRTNSDDTGFVESYPTHQSASQAFCAGKFHYYVGDMEIIAQNARQHFGCDFDGYGQSYTDDRYAIFGKLSYDDPNRVLLLARFFELVSQKTMVTPSIIDSAFDETFIGITPTRKLEVFNWAIRGPKP